MNESELARLEQLGRQIEETGESFLAQLYHEGQIRELQHRRAKLVTATHKRMSMIVDNSEDPQIPRDVAALAEIDAQLQDLSVELLRVTPVDRRFPN
jgi:hypothetical protein